MKKIFIVISIIALFSCKNQSLNIDGVPSATAEIDSIVDPYIITKITNNGDKDIWLIEAKCTYTYSFFGIKSSGEQVVTKDQIIGFNIFTNKGKIKAGSSKKVNLCNVTNLFLDKDKTKIDYIKASEDQNSNKMSFNINILN